MHDDAEKKKNLKILQSSRIDRLCCQKLIAIIKHSGFASTMEEKDKLIIAITEKYIDEKQNDKMLVKPHMGFYQI